jgi:hypothetical protein
VQILCHCTDCKKISGGNYSSNILVPEGEFQLVQGTPKSISKIADSGETMTSYFCGDCGTTLYRETKTYGPNKIIKTGILDNASDFEARTPAAEIFTESRPEWVTEIPGASQSNRA